MSRERRRDRKARRQDETAPAAAPAADEPDAVLEGLLADVTEPDVTESDVPEPDVREPDAEGRDLGPTPTAEPRRPAGSMGDPTGPPPGTRIGSPVGPVPGAHPRRVDPIAEAAALGAPVKAGGPGAAGTERAQPSRRQRRADKKRSDQLVAAATSTSASTAAARDGDEPRRGRRMRAFRFPALLVVVALLVGAFVVERRVTSPIDEVVTGPDLSRVMPTAAPADAVSSTWFCAGGTALGDGSSAPKAATVAPGTTVPAGPGTTVPVAPKPAVVAEQSITIANGNDAGQAVKVTVYPSEGAPTVRQLDLGGHAREELRLSDVVKAPYASALVESNGGLLTVEQTVQGPTGRSVGACASSPSASWYFAAGSTALGTREIFVAFNPFPADAVLDFSFQVEEEGGRQASRDSDKLKGKLVPANGVVAFDVSDVVTVRNQLSTVVRTRGGEGRVVVARLLVSDGSSNQPKSMNLNLGAPAPMSTWLFADGPVYEPGVQASYVVYNPGSSTLQAAVSVQPDALSPGMDVAPFDVTVRPGQFEVIPVTSARVPANSGYWVSVQSRTGGAFVAERVVRSDPPAARPGVAYTVGSPLVATRWQVAAAGVSGETFGELSIANVAESDPVTLTLRVERGGTSEVLAAFDRVELGAGRRTVLDLATLGADGVDRTASISVESTGPVVVERAVGFADPAVVADSMAVPVRGTVALPPDDLFDRLGAALPPTPGGTLPPGTLTLPPGSVPSGTAPPGSAPPGSLVPESLPSDGPAPLDGGTLPPVSAGGTPSVSGPDGGPVPTTVGPG